MPKVIHFEIPADKPERAVKFYKNVFNWDINNGGGPFNYWLATTGPEDLPGINGAIMEKTDEKGIRIAMEVPSIDEYGEKILESGGKMVMPKSTVPGVGYLATFQDTEGNIFHILEENPEVG